MRQIHDPRAGDHEHEWFVLEVVFEDGLTTRILGCRRCATEEPSPRD